MRSRNQSTLAAFALPALLGLLAGCPAKSACPLCTISGVRAEAGTANPTPTSAVNLQLSSSSAGAVKQVDVTLTAADGSTETLTYSGDKVSGINSSSMTTIGDNELYDIGGKAPARASVAILFTSGKSQTDALAIEAETPPRSK